MFKRFAVFFAALMAVAVSALSAVSAQGQVPFEVRATRQSGIGVDRIFEFDVVNTTDRPLFASGRVVFLNVYDATLPVTVPVSDVRFLPGGVETVSVRWEDAPLAGQVRALLVLNDGQDPPLIQTFIYFVFPWTMAGIFVGIAALAAALALAVMRLPKYLKARVPPNMLTYVVEGDDTVVTLSARFDVTWQDIVRANRLKPPYTLKTGRRIFIPKHGLRRPTPEQAN